MHIRPAALVAVICLFLSLMAGPAAAADSPVAWVQAASGEATIVAPDGTSRAAAPEDGVLALETLATGPDGSMQVMFPDRTMLAMGPDSQLAVLTVMDTDGDGSLALDLMEGTVRVLTSKLMRENPEQFSMSTPLGLIGIRGTEFGSLVESGREVHMLYEGGPVAYTDTQPETNGENLAALCEALADAVVKTKKGIKLADQPAYLGKKRQLAKNLDRLELYQKQYGCTP